MLCAVRLATTSLTVSVPDTVALAREVAPATVKLANVPRLVTFG